MRYNRGISALILSVLAIALGLLASRREPVVDGRPSPAERMIAGNLPDLPSPEPSYAGTVGRNASFFDLMSACGLHPGMIHDIARRAKPVYDFRRIYPGQQYEVYTDTAGCLERLTFSISDEEYVEVLCEERDVRAERRSYDFDVERHCASGLITSSLYAALQEQEVPVEVGAQLVDIFAWDIDFFTDVRKNDYFRVVYEEKTRGDGLCKIGAVIAAEFNTKGESHYAFLFENDAAFPDYFDDTGRSLRKELLRAPLQYSRISSGYSKKRLHPVLNHYAPHQGIDYSAPAGTPVMSTGDGTVMTASRRRGNGNYIKIRHNQEYITYYLHLSRFAKGIREGVKVKQGQVIGFVGSTGYATGPHLDYRVKRNGRFVNPRNLKLPPAKPVTDENMAAFAALRDALISKLSAIPVKDSRTERYIAGAPASTGGVEGGAGGTPAGVSTDR